MKALWSRIDLLASASDNGPDEDTSKPWVWYPRVNLQALAEPTMLDQIRAKVWKALKATQAKQGICLMGQLFPLFESPATTATKKWWARVSDLEHVSEYPVALAFWLPPNVPVNRDSSYVTVEQLLPPAPIGEIGVVWTGKYAVAYPITLLSEDSLQLCESINEDLRHLLVSAETLDQWIQISEALKDRIQQLVSRYWQLYQQRSVTTRKTLPGIQNVFEGRDRLPIPADLAVEAVISGYSNASSKNSRWTQGVYPQFEFERQDGIALVEVRPSGTASRVVDETTSNSLWERVRKLGDRDGDVVIAALAHYLSATPEDDEGYVTISGALVLDYRSITPIMKADPGHKEKRRAGHRREDLVEVSECFDRMMATWITIKQKAQVDGKRRRTIRLKSPLIQVKNVIQQEETVGEDGKELLLSGGGAVAGAAGNHIQGTLPLEEPALASQSSYNIAWLYRPGNWFSQSANQKRPIAWLCKKALSYDLEGEFWERRLARLFLFRLRIPAMGGGKIVLSIGYLFHVLSLPINERDPEKTRKRFEKAMKRLIQDKQIGGWGPIPSNPSLPRTKWIQAWLSWKIFVKVDPLIALRKEFAEELKELIAQGLGLTQDEVRRFLEINRSMGHIAKLRLVSLSQLRTMELRAFQRISEKVVNVGDTAQEIIDDALQQFRQEPESLDEFIVHLFVGDAPNDGEVQEIE